jgi:hypothetical protein
VAINPKAPLDWVYWPKDVGAIENQSNGNREYLPTEVVLNQSGGYRKAKALWQQLAQLIQKVSKLLHDISRCIWYGGDYFLKGILSSQ